MKGEKIKDKKMRILRRTARLGVSLVMMLALGTGAAFGASDITAKDVKDGLDFCKEYPVTMKLDGKVITVAAKDVPPLIIPSKNRTLIPARAVFEALGGKVEWDNDKRMVIVNYENTKVELTIDSKTADVNGKSQLLDVPAMVVDHDGDGYGSTMIPLRFTAESIGCKVDWLNDSRTITIESPKKEDKTGEKEEKQEEAEKPAIDFSLYPVLNEDGTKTGMNLDTGEEFIYKDGNKKADTYVGKVDWNGPMLNDGAKTKLIVIDAGHGGKDTGAIGHKDQSDETYEKDINLQAALKLNAYLRAAGATTYMTRSTDEALELMNRSWIANNERATFFVSCHNNSNVSNAPNGTEVHYNSKVNDAGQDEKELYGLYSKDVAAAVQKEFVAELGTKDRGIKSSPALSVLRRTKMPAIIVEGAFISNDEDLAKMRKSDYADRYGKAVAKGIVKALNAAFK